MDPYVELDFFSDPVSPWWSYQTSVQPSAGKGAEWQVDQSVPLPTPLPASASAAAPNSLRVRVKDKNSIRKDVLIGKGVVSLEELLQTSEASGEGWSSRTVQLKNKKGKASGEVVLTFRSQQPVSPASATSASSLPPASADAASVTGQSVSLTLAEITESSELTPVFLVSLQRSVYDPAIMSRKERLERICLKFGVRAQERSSLLGFSFDAKGEGEGEEICVLLTSLTAAAVSGESQRRQREQELGVLLECAQEVQSLQPIPLVSSPSSPVSALV
jgi:hypothetical protein